MTNVQTRSKWAACKTLLLALPLLVLGFAAAPQAQADEHHGFYRRHGYYRAHGGRHVYRRERAYDHGYYHGGRHYRYRRYYGGARPYYRYYDSYPSSGIVVRIR